MPRQPILTASDILRYLRQGKTQAEIAEIFGVTPAYVSKIKTGAGIVLSAREEVRRYWPWKVPAGLQDMSIPKRLRDHLEYFATRGRGMRRDALVRLRSFYQKLFDNNLVVEFHPDIPPNSDAKHGGWIFRPRVDTDGDLMIRVNEVTNLPDMGDVVWRLPDRADWPKV